MSDAERLGCDDRAAADGRAGRLASVDDLRLALPDGRVIAGADDLVLKGGRERAHRGPVGFGQVDLPARRLRHLALRLGPHPGAGGPVADAAAAEALHPERHAAQRRHLSGRCRAPTTTRPCGTRSRPCGSTTWPRAWTATSPGHSASRAASSSASPSRARSSPSRTGSSSTRPPPPWTRTWRPPCTASSPSACPADAVSIGHRSTLRAMHDRQLAMRDGGDRTFTLGEARTEPAPAGPLNRGRSERGAAEPRSAAVAGPSGRSSALREPSAQLAEQAEEGRLLVRAERVRASRASRRARGRGESATAARPAGLGLTMMRRRSSGSWRVVA